MLYDVQVHHCTEVRFVCFFSGDFTTMAVINPPEKKLETHTSVHCQFLLLRHFCRNGLLSLNFAFSTSQLNLVVFFENIFIGWSLFGYTKNQLTFTTDNCKAEQSTKIINFGYSITYSTIFISQCKTKYFLGMADKTDFVQPGHLQYCRLR